ncbi:MAG: DUF1318 domain-containing protein [Lentisphaeria bacterium]|jgi:hypothetical protein
MRPIRPPLLLAAIALLLAAGSPATRAQQGPAEAAVLKQRMAERLPPLTQWKAQGILGENNRGLLEFMAGAARQPAAEKAVAAENADRLAVYGKIARKNNSTAEAVGKARAQQIAAQAPPGSWLQDATGDWRQK